MNSKDNLPLQPNDVWTTVVQVMMDKGEGLTWMYAQRLSSEGSHAYIFPGRLLPTQDGEIYFVFTNDDFDMKNLQLIS
jgi:hypothetical protein